MNRFKAAIGIREAYKNVYVFVQNTELDMSKYKEVAEGIYELPTTEHLSEDDPVTINENGVVIKTGNDSLFIGYVVDLVKEIQKEQDRYKRVVREVEEGKPNLRFLHDHPGLQQRLNLDAGHVIVDRNHWERALAVLSGNQLKFLLNNKRERPLRIHKRLPK